MSRRDRPFLERVRFDRKSGEFVEEESLRERLPTYVKVFALGLLIETAVGIGIWLVSSAALSSSVGYTLIFSGTLLLLVGGARGGGYSNLSIAAFEAVVGGRNRSGDFYEEDADIRRGNVMKRRDPMDRLRRGLRPPPNPTAFWQAVAGLLYVVLGLPLTF